jgi:hypothetical protein
MFLSVSKRCLLIVLLAFASSVLAQAQSAGEYGGAVSKTGGAGASARSSKPEVTAPPAPSAHLPPKSGESVATVNRRVLEERAGADAAQVALRSEPDHAQVWIDGLFAGVSPLDLKLAPGRHRVEMGGSGLDLRRQEVTLAAKEARTIVLSLKSQYPQRISLH